MNKLLLTTVLVAASIAAPLLTFTGCKSSPSATVFHIEKTVGDGAKAATHTFNVYYHQFTNTASPADLAAIERDRQSIYAADRKIAATLLEVDDLRASLAITNSPDVRAKADALLFAASDQSTNILRLVKIWVK